MNVNVDLIVRVAAGLAAIAMVAWPALVAAQQTIRRWLSSSPSRPEAGIDDMRVVLELANRLRMAGNAEGVTLCQQLLDVMLKGKPS